MGRWSPSRSVVTMTVRRVIRRPSQFLSKIVLLLEPTKQVVTFVIGHKYFIYSDQLGYHPLLVISSLASALVYLS